MATKRITFRVPEPLYERFFRLYPGDGERSAVLRTMLDALTKRDENVLRKAVTECLIEELGGRGCHL